MELKENTSDIDLNVLTECGKIVRLARMEKKWARYKNKGGHKLIKALVLTRRNSQKPLMSDGFHQMSITTTLKCIIKASNFEQCVPKGQHIDLIKKDPKSDIVSLKTNHICKSATEMIQ